MLFNALLLDLSALPERLVDTFQTPRNFIDSQPAT